MTKKTILVFLLMIAGTVGLNLVAPWWAPVPWIVIIVALSNLNPKEGSFLGGFSIAIVWLLMARYMSQQDHEGIISKTGVLLGGLSHQWMVTLTLLIAFITGALSGWFGSALGNLFPRKTKTA
jgi:hypothetical protein